MVPTAFTKFKAPEDKKVFPKSAEAPSLKGDELLKKILQLKHTSAFQKFAATLMQKK